MSSTGDDELSDAGSQASQTLQNDPGNPSQPPPSAQAPSQLPSSPPLYSNASLDGANDDRVSDDGESDSSSEDRPNRFEGPAGTWRHYTEQERETAASLDQQRANDLGVHLYNAHSLKSRNYSPTRASQISPWKDKSHWLRRNEAGELPWHPDRNWTAWPLPANEVPRREETFGVPIEHLLHDGEILRKEESWVPSADLRDEIEALMLRKAKARFRSRNWAIHEEPQVPPNPPEATSGVNGGDDRPGSDSHSDEEEGGVQTFKAENTQLPRHQQQHHYSPAFLADDDQAGALVRPTVRHIVSKFDDLLIGLHESRQGHRQRAPFSRSRSRRSRSRSNSKPAATSSQSQPRPHSSEKRGNVDHGSHGQESEYEDNYEASTSGDDEAQSVEKGRRRPSGQSKKELGLRDWSEVLGVAALTGWDQTVIDRTARRCAALFGEKMAMRFMPEMPVDKANDEVVEYLPETIPPLESEDSEQDEEVGEAVSSMDKGQQVKKGGWQCPYENCARHHEVYEQRWRWREHLKRTHKLNEQQLEEVEAEHSQKRDSHIPVEAGPDVDDGQEEKMEMDDEDALKTNERALGGDECSRNMADKSDKGAKEFTPRELEIMAKAWKCMTEEPKLDYDMLAAECGMTNPRSASNAWRGIRAKLLANAGISKDANGDANGEGAAAGNGSAKPTPTRKRAKAKTEKHDDDESPTKKARGAATGKGKKGKKTDAAAVDEEVDGEEGGKVKTEAVDDEVEYA
ncbi:hypothetical protein KC333_g1559 [Hortaea werneckii]|nr:hypothetical protein KC333_g1559 [Hortaea werneckii]KAI7322522.1 hypothetical protein KC326_g1811 [Hortaea werneckii]